MAYYLAGCRESVRLGTTFEAATCSIRAKEQEDKFREFEVHRGGERKRGCRGAQSTGGGVSVTCWSLGSLASRVISAHVEREVVCLSLVSVAWLRLVQRSRWAAISDEVGCWLSCRVWSEPLKRYLKASELNRKISKVEMFQIIQWTVYMTPECLTRFKTLEVSASSTRDWSSGFDLALY